MNIIRSFSNLKPLLITCNLYRYCIVIDDICDISVWKMIRCALPDNDTGYIIIITTHISDVAEQAGGAYKLKPFWHRKQR